MKMFRSTLLSVFAMSSVVFANDGIPAPVCFDSSVCILKVTKCYPYQDMGNGTYVPAHYYLTTRTAVECVAYNGTKVTTAKQNTEVKSFGGSRNIALCEQGLEGTIASLPSCQDSK